MRTTHYISGSNAYVTLFSTQFLEGRLFHCMRLLSKCKIEHIDEWHYSLLSGLRLRWKCFHFERVCRGVNTPRTHPIMTMRTSASRTACKYTIIGLWQCCSKPNPEASRRTSQTRKLSNDVFSTRQVQNADSCIICTNASRSSWMTPLSKERPRHHRTSRCADSELQRKAYPNVPCRFPCFKQVNGATGCNWTPLKAYM